MAASYRKERFSVKKTKLLIFFTIAILLFSSIAANASSNITIDTQKADEGVIRVSSDKLDKKIKVMVEKGSTKYYYDLNKEEEFFPLQLGQGNYTVTVLENSSGNKYKALAKKSFKADISGDNSVYLKSIQLVFWEENMEAIKLAKAIAKDEQDKAKVVQVIYDYIINNIQYDYEKIDKLSTDYIPEIDSILKDKKGICYDYSSLFSAMLRSQGIPTKLVKGYRNEINTYHAWNEVYLDGSWKIIDTTYDSWTLKNGTTYSTFQDADQYNKLKEF